MKTNIEKLEELIAALSDDYKINVEKYGRGLKGEYNWLFTFKGGGFNSIFANDEKSAIKKAQNTYNSQYSIVDINSFKKATVEMAEEQNRLGYSMTC